jgi:Single-stranded DNA-specific exonuclease
MRTKLVNENFSENYLENLLKARGINNIAEYKNPTEDYLQSPSDLKNIGQAAALYTRIVLQPNPRILVIVDPDVDGFTSATIIYKYTLEMNCHAQIDYWLHEGKAHGLSEHIGRLLESDINYDLLILPDSSSNDATYHNMLNDVHIPCLILDHHITDEALSDNAIVVNNQMSPNYTNKELTGAGVTWQFCRYIDEKIGQNWAEKYIDLAAWGIVADMGGMINMENRYIVCKGFKKISNDFFK